MDEAISRAEREATDAAGFANKAQEQLVEWTDGEKSVIAQLQKMAKVLESPAFVSVTNAFVEQHKSVFDFTDENK
ncbi:hypothetical protein T492DRAFT_859439 [Pavlovales sp. CCMP2436]|nr:hypothetical protein T492DRAFT_859439 [Pavlovales sp. CCMP2436]